MAEPKEAKDWTASIGHADVQFSQPDQALLAEDATKVYSVRLPVSCIAELRDVADRRHTAPSSLLRQWVLERLDSEHGRGAQNANLATISGADLRALIVDAVRSTVADQFHSLKRGVSVVDRLEGLENVLLTSDHGVDEDDILLRVEQVLAGLEGLRSEVKLSSDDALALRFAAVELLASAIRGDWSAAPDDVAGTQRQWESVLDGLAEHGLYDLARRLVGRLERSQAASKLGIELPRSYVVGVELRPYMYVIGLFDDLGRRLSGREVPLANMAIKNVVDSIAVSVVALVTEALGNGASMKRMALGIQLGAPVDTQSGIVHQFCKRPPTKDAYADFDWNNEPLGELLQQATGLPTVVENDANALALRECWDGLGQFTSEFAVMLMREEVGGSVVTGGDLFPGPVEVGKFITSFVGYGSDGDYQFAALERTAGVTAIERSINDSALLREPVTSLEMAVQCVESTDPEEAKFAKDAFDRAGSAIAWGISYLIGFSGPTHLALYVPSLMLKVGSDQAADYVDTGLSFDGIDSVDPPREAAQVFMQQVSMFRSYVPYGAYSNCQLTLRSAGLYDGAFGAALAALRRCFGVPLSAGRVGERMPI